MRSVQALLCVSLLAACAGNPAPVPVEANRADLSAMAGRWEGSYRNDATGRTGGILFTLSADRDSATGDVIMDPISQYAGGTWAGAGERALPGAGGSARILSIRFVRLHGSQVTGSMAPYTAPDCNCTVRTMFVGRASGNAIAGTFTTQGEGARTTRGEWEVHRVR